MLLFNIYLSLLKEKAKLMSYRWKDEFFLMPLYQMREIWTPLKLVGVKFFKSDDNSIFIKVFNQHRRRLK